MSERILFLGNGVNRVAERNTPYSWSRVLQNLQSKHVPSGFQMSKADNISFVLLLQSVLNFNLMSLCGESAPLQKFKDEIAVLEPTFVHRYLCDLVKKGDFKSTITTNYDYAFERAFSKKFIIEQDYTIVDGHKVHHIHGSARNTESDIVMSMETYQRQLQRIIDTQPEWLIDFREKEVHICGFSFYPEELIVWYALGERLKKLQKQQHFKELSNRCFVYLFCTNQNYEQQKNLALLLKSYAAHPIMIPVPQIGEKEDYQSAWQQLFGRMQMIFNEMRLCAENNNTFGVEKYGFLESRNKNVSAAYVPSHKFPHLCRIGIPDKKRELITAHTDTWCFYVEIEGCVYLWSAPIRDIMISISSIPQTAHRNSNNGYDFYLDYSAGKLYTCSQHSSSAELCEVCQLSKEPDFSSFKSKIFTLN